MSRLGHLDETASQTAGPYVHIGLVPRLAGLDPYAQPFGAVIGGPGDGERIVIEGRVFDGLGQPMKDVLLEIWHADAHGHYAHPADPQPSALRCWARAGADLDTGVYRFETIKPGAVGAQAPHIAVFIAARGINLGLHTRLYFADEADANARDPVLNGIEAVPRRRTLIATRSERGGEAVYTFDIRVQGDDETVFFDV